MKLIPTSKIDKIKNSEIKKLYSNHVNKGLTQILSKFSYNKKLVKNADGIYLKLSAGLIAYLIVRKNKLSIKIQDNKSI